MDYLQAVSVNKREEKPKHIRNVIADSLSRMRFQLFGGLLFAVLIPSLARGQFERILDPALSYQHSIIGTTSALLLGYLVFRKMSVLPGAKSIVNIVPAFLVAYAIVVVFFFLMRIEYSRYQFLASFLLTCFWFATIHFIVARFRRPIFYVLPGPHTSSLQTYRGIRWKVLKSERMLERYPHVPVIVDLRDENLEPKWERIIAEEAIKGRRVLSARQLYESLTGRVQIEHLSENTFGHLVPDALYAPAKRYVDLAAALCVIAIFWPIMLITAIAIRVESPGPSIFKQVRMGFRGREFTVYKFRSMRIQSESATDLQSDKTMSDDERITRVGRFIRKTRVDELPQVFNILKGDMSWIGPRPETLRLSKWYENEISFYRYRHIVRPGISGWAQVKQGHVTEVEDIRLKLEYDMFYVKNFSLWLDLLVVVKTIFVIFTGKGAK